MNVVFREVLGVSALAGMPACVECLRLDKLPRVPRQFTSILTVGIGRRIQRAGTWARDADP